MRKNADLANRKRHSLMKARGWVGYKTRRQKKQKPLAE